MKKEGGSPTQDKMEASADYKLLNRPGVGDVSQARGRHTSVPHATDVPRTA